MSWIWNPSLFIQESLGAVAPRQLWWQCLMLVRQPRNPRTLLYWPVKWLHVWYCQCVKITTCSSVVLWSTPLTSTISRVALHSRIQIDFESKLWGNWSPRNQSKGSMKCLIWMPQASVGSDPPLKVALESGNQGDTSGSANGRCFWRVCLSWIPGMVACMWLICQ